MRDIFTYLCNFSVVTSIAIVVAVLLRPVLKKGPSFIRCALWALVFLRLLIPVGFSDLPFSVPTVFEAEETITAPQSNGETVAIPNDETVKEEVKEENEGKEENNVIQQAPSKPVQKPISGTVTEPQKPQNAPVADTPIEENTATPKVENKVDVIKVLSVIWAVGAVLMLGYMLASNLVLKYRVRGAIVYDSRIRVLDRDCSPFVFGFFRPIIYIPASAKRSDWGYIIAHESTHIKRLDHIVKPLAFLALCLYWYNPLVWAAYILFSKDIEYACDERTVKTMESEDKKAYSLALLSVSQSTGRIFAPLSFGEVSVKERIKRVMKFKNSLWAMSLAAVICISLLIFIACTPDGENPASSDLSSEESSVVSGEETSQIIESSENVEASENAGDESGDESSQGSELYDDTEPLKVWVDYVPKEEAGVTPTFVDGEMTAEYIKIWVNKPVESFKFISVLYDENTMEPYAGDTLWETDELTPEGPFYAKSYVWEALSQRGISYRDEHGAAVFCRINYNTMGGEATDSALGLEEISPDAPSALISTAKSFLTALNAGDEAGYKAYITKEFEEGFKHKIYDVAVDFSSFYGRLNVSSLKNFNKVGNTYPMHDYPKYYYVEYKHYTPYTATIEYLNENGAYEEKIFRFIMVAASDGGYVVGDFRLSAAEIEYPDDSEAEWHEHLKPVLNDEEIEKVCRIAEEYIVALSMGDEAKARSLGSLEEVWFLGRVSTDFFYCDYNMPQFAVELEDRRIILLFVGFDFFGEHYVNEEPYLGYFYEKQVMQISLYDDGSCYVDGLTIEE